MLSRRKIAKGSAAMNLWLSVENKIAASDYFAYVLRLIFHTCPRSLPPADTLFLSMYTTKRLLNEELKMKNEEL
jgi:hypothetical protein